MELGGSKNLAKRGCDNAGKSTQFVSSATIKTEDKIDNVCVFQCGMLCIPTVNGIVDTSAAEQLRVTDAQLCVCVCVSVNSFHRESIMRDADDGVD